jgi:hypothetical protein
MCNSVKFVAKMFVYINLFQYLCIVKRAMNDSNGNIGIFAGAASSGAADQCFAGRVDTTAYEQD